MSIFSKLMASQYHFDGGGYVTDGLIFMFDGIWNTGKNKHNINAQFMMNLVDGKKYPLTAFSDGYSFTEDSLCINPTNVGLQEIVPIDTSDVRTVEFVLRFSSGLFTDNIIFKVNEWQVVAKKENQNINNMIIRFIMPSDTNNYVIKSEFYRKGDYTKKFGVSLAFTNLDSTFSIIKFNPNEIVAGHHVSNPYPKEGASFNTFGIRIGGNSSLNTYISCIRVYNRELSVDEINANQSIDNSRFNISS